MLYLYKFISECQGNRISVDFGRNQLFANENNLANNEILLLNILTNIISLQDCTTLFNRMKQK